jgi:hypothetical protein
MPAAAQSCSAEATQALTAVGANCAALGDNAACYGYNGVNAQFAEPVTFNAPGNIAPLPPLQTIQTRPFNSATGEWGIAVLRLQGNLPGTLPGQLVTLLLMGDVQVSATDGTGAPMQAFSLRVGVGQPQCQGLPPSSITVNGPQRASLDLTVNGASMRLGSNVTIRATADGRLRFLVTAGHLQIENGPIIPVGFAATVSVDDEGDIVTDSWDAVEPMTAEELEEFAPLEDLPEDVLGEEFPLPSEDEAALLAALDFDLLLGLDPYLAFALAEDWTANGITPDDLEGVTADDVQAYLLDNLDAFAVDDAFLAAMGDSFGLSDDELLGLADELGIPFDPEASLDGSPDGSGDGGDSGEGVEPPAEPALPDVEPPVEVEPPPVEPPALPEPPPPGDLPPPPDGGGGEGGEGGGEGGG